MHTKFEAWELLMALFAVPLALRVAFWHSRKLFARHADSAATPATPATTAAPLPSTPPHLAPLRPPVLAILGASLRLPHGASTEALATALADHRGDADLDPELVDAGGHPVVTARSGAAMDGALRADILAWLTENGLADLRFSDEQWRALVLATQVTAELAGQAAQLLMPAVDPSGLLRPLRLIPLLPAEWTSAQRRAAAQWLEHTVAQAGWPASRIERARSTLPGPDEASPAAPFGHLAHEAVLTNAPLSALVLACASHVGGATVAQWAADDSLFTSAQPQGRVPGEGAAGLLVLDERQAGSIGGAAIVHLDALREMRSASSADASRQVDTALLASVIDSALEHAGAALADVAMVVADTGERPRRVLELLGSVAALSRLDPGRDIARVGTACGSCGVVSFIAALALARHHALAREAPVLCVSNEDAYRRIAALLMPVRPQLRSMP
jgi:hypothetical protein